jgi:hypothetical protein
MKLFPIANDLNPYLLFLYLFQRAKGSTSVVTLVQTCSKVTISTPSLFPIANDLNHYLLFMYLFQRVIWSHFCSNLLQGNKLNTFFVSDCKWSQPLPLVLVLVSAGQRVINIWSRSCSDLLQGNKLHTFFVFDCEWYQPLPLVLVLVKAGQRVNIWSRSCSDLLQGNKLDTFVSFVRINYKVLI